MQKPSNKPTIIGLMVAAVALVGYVLAVGHTFGQLEAAMAQATPTQAPQCQYPQRPLNPDGSCNNEDPCDPQTLKTPGLWGACKDPTPPNPDRDYYDINGCRYKWDGTLRECPAVESQPVGGK